MDRKAKRSKEIYTATVLISSGTQVQDLMTGALFLIEKDTHFSAWYQKEKMQWFYWTIFFKDPKGRETVAKVRRDKATIKPGTFRLCARDVMQKKTAKIIKAHSFQHMRTPPPPPINKKQQPKETCPQEWKNIYQSLCELERNMYIKRPWTDNRKASYQAARKRKEEERLFAQEKENELKASQVLEDGEMPEQA